jgi:hypothetical protein
LVECAWSYKFPARKTKHIKHKEKDASIHARQVAWEAQTRLCIRYQTLIQSGKCKNQIIVAIARELIGFIWEIVIVETHKLKQAQMIK